MPAVEETEGVEDAAPTKDDGLTFEKLLLAVSIKSTKSDSILTMDDYLSAEPAPIPWQAMYGKMKEWAQQTELSMSVAYTAILAAYSAIPKYDGILGVRFNLYATLLMPVGGGKNLARISHQD